MLILKLFSFVVLFFFMCFMFFFICLVVVSGMLNFVGLLMLVLMKFESFVFMFVWIFLFIGVVEFMESCVLVKWLLKVFIEESGLLFVGYLFWCSKVIKELVVLVLFFF